MTSSPQCIVCGSDAGRPLYRVLRRCEQCGMVWAPLSLTSGDLQRLYDEGYFKGEEYVNYIEDRPFLEKNFRLRLGTLQRYLTPEHRRCLEIGCAYGFFLHAAREHFTHVEGVDISEAAVRYARQALGVNARAGDFLTMDFQGTFDVVCLWDTIEHLARPDLYIQKAASLLRAGGLIALTTGDIGSRIARRRREKWRMIHPPTHLYYFSRATLRRLLDRFGFEVAHEEACGFYRSFSNVAYNIFALRWNKPGLYRFAERLLSLSGVRGFYFNAGDIMYLIGRRRP
ncbi:MAG: hypothetical protein Kow0059_02150 [Candidatus Sumerlaeia bacterium]